MTSNPESIEPEDNGLIYLPEESYDDAPPDEFRSHGLKLLVSAAGRIKDKANRELALLTALRSCREELEAAKFESEAADKRLEEVKNVYDLATRVLAGYTPFEQRTVKKKTPGIDGGQAAKRIKIKRESTDLTADPTADVDTTDHGPKNEEEVPLPTNPIILPQQYTEAKNMPPELVAEHKEAFYQKLLHCSVSDLPSYIPPHTSANLKSKTQLAEWIYIARNWNTGADGMDAGAFRAKYKTWYSRMKPVTVNLGRRTGIHLRTLPDDGTVLCRHSKDGSKSIVYLDVERLFDALFEIHSVELGHRGRDATKNLADERYANIPDAQVRHFIETCPVCLGKKKGDSFGIL
ncbi:hypothetical protein ACHAWX_004331 [Stephanocyclus meneghinianus]